LHENTRIEISCTVASVTAGKSLGINGLSSPNGWIDPLLSMLFSGPYHFFMNFNPDINVQAKTALVISHTSLYISPLLAIIFTLAAFGEVLTVVSEI